MVNNIFYKSHGREYQVKYVGPFASININTLHAATDFHDLLSVSGGFNAYVWKVKI